MSKRKPYQPTQCELEGAPKAFLYEIRMFRQSVKILERLGLFYNEVLEAGLLHARNLLDFFCGSQSTKDTICVGHFISKSSKDEATDLWKSSKLPFLDSQRKNINKSLSHLTYSRIAEKYKWDMARIKDEIEAAYDELLQLLPEKDRGKWQLPKE